ncbi:MAG TPA: hypothetical protein VGL02_03640 [Streptomyces sp.]
MPLTVQGRQLLAGSGDVTLRGEHQPGPAADVRLGRISAAWYVFAVSRSYRSLPVSGSLPAYTIAWKLPDGSSRMCPRGRRR